MTIPAMRIPLILCVALATACASSGKKKTATTPLVAEQPSTAAAAHSDQKYAQAYEIAHQSVAEGQLQAALPTINSIIAHYEAEHIDPKMRNYTARSQAETLHYLLSSASETSLAGGTDTVTEAQVVSILWSDAYYLRAYISIEQQQLTEAEKWLQKALALAPMNARYLSELGHVYQLRRNWKLAFETYQAARGAADLSPEDRRIYDQTRAMRGIGYVLIETGDLDRAIAIYQECLRLNPDDATAKNELMYILELRNSVDSE